MPLSLSDRSDLRGLVDAITADTRDDDAFVALFTPDAVLTIHQNGAALGTFSAPDGLRAATPPPSISTASRCASSPTTPARRPRTARGAHAAQLLSDAPGSASERRFGRLLSYAPAVAQSA